ncbi:MAG: methyl-accepting chemotaxis protein [Geobacteraceae bacterium]|nr:methyl-accepting chemotaxis protein [Geobacteraceae bacterium]
MKTSSSQNGTSGLTLRTKMILLFTAAFTCILLVAVVSMILLNESRIGGPSYTLIKNNKDALESIALLKSDLFQINSEMQDFMLEGDVTVANKSEATIKKLTTNIDMNFNNAIASIESPQNRDSINKTRRIWQDYKKTLLDEVLPAVAKGDILKASYLMTGVQTQRFNTFSSSVASMVTIMHSNVSKTEEQVASSIQAKMMLAGFVTLIAIAVIAIFSFFITTSITHPLRACVDFARAVADGKLDARLSVTGGGEAADLAAAMNTMAENLHSMVSRISSASEVLTVIDNNIGKSARKVVNSAHLQEAAVLETSQAVDHINRSVSEVSGGIERLATSASETSASILEMAASVEEVAISAEKLGDSVDEVSSSIIEMTASIKEISTSIVNLLDASSTTASSIAEMDATIKQVEKNAMDTSVITEGVKKDAETGKLAVEEAIAGMQAIRSSSRITAEVVENLSLRANDIGAILSVIDEVAEQTNLLALNAAIIAAQAGEHGKGFAVVADEIRELAERTSSSTREIAAVITGVQEETRRAVDAISQAEHSITEGEKLSQHSGTALAKIVSGVQKASNQVREIARTTVEQARGSQSIKEAMESVEEMVGYIANSAREHSRGSELITTAVEQMKELTNHVRTSTREQSRTSNLIAHATEDVTTLIDRIRVASASQSQSSAMISKAVVNIKTSTASNTETATVMESSITGLSKQIDLLEKEMSGFTI